MNIILTSGHLKIKKIHKRTRAKMFKDLNVGDAILLSIPVRYAGSNRGSTHASYIQIENIKSGECVYKSFNEITPILELFEFEPGS